MKNKIDTLHYKLEIKSFFFGIKIIVIIKQIRKKKLKIELKYKLY